MIIQIAMEQSAIDSNCKVEDFKQCQNVITVSKENVNARRYLKLPHICDLTSYGNNIVATVDEKYMATVSDYINTYAVEHCFETPNMHILNDAFQKDGYRVCFMAEYFLPDVEELVALPCKYETKVLLQRILRIYTKRNGVMPFAKTERNLMYLELVRMRKED